MTPLLAAAATRRITVSGTTLFEIAAIYLGDASQWTRIARANGLTDPWLSGIVDLTIPARATGSTDGGVLG